MKKLKTTRILLDISHSFVKEIWFSVIICGKIVFSLLANTLEKILYNTLHRLMGRNSETNSGFLTFGIKVVKV